ncbi:MAG: hypothetical protein AB1847_02815 [bacterium]
MERYLKKLSLVVCIAVALTAMLGLQAKMAWSAPNSTIPIPPACTTNPVQEITSVGPEVLLVEDVLPWQYSPNCAAIPVLGAVEQALNGLAKIYDRVNSITFRTMTKAQLQAYKIIIIPGDQDNTFYANVTANITNLQLAVQGGVFAIVHLVEGPNNGVIDGRQILPYTSGGFNAGYTPYGVLQGGTNSILISAPNNCIIATSPAQPASAFQNWQYSAHGYFDAAQLPTGTTTILTDGMSGDPTMILYPLGSGKVLASTMTAEYAYGTAIYPTLLTREIYCTQQAVPPPVTLEALEAKLDLLTTSINNISAALTTLQNTVNSISAQTTDMQPRVTDTQTTVNEIDNEVEAIETKMDEKPFDPIRPPWWRTQNQTRLPFRQ